MHDYMCLPKLAVTENLDALVLLVPTGMCLLKPGFNEVSMATFQAVVASKLHPACNES